MDQQPLRLATRGSELALWQTRHVAALFEKLKKRPVEIVVIETNGDKILDKPLSQIGDKGLFTAELEEALLEGRVDGAVHSLKDLPTQMDSRFTIAACVQREDSSDTIVFPGGKSYPSIQSLPKGFVLGTSSLRRKAQFLKLNPHLVIKDVRGNLQTRIQKLLSGQYDGISLAYAGLKRMNYLKRQDLSVMVLSQREILPAVSQGCIAIQTLNTKKSAQLFAKLDHKNTRIEVEFERELLRQLHGGCSLPLGVFSEIVDGEMILKAVLLKEDGTEWITLSGATRTFTEMSDVVASMVGEIQERGKTHLLDCVQKEK